tara:strand:- start:331 stop:816 length:486 start_codon:yes stop_codon:yes gene_type:complete
MAGTGSGLLQPTKLIQNDDFMETIALPGYFSTDWTLGGDLDAKFYVVPDGMTVEVVDFGYTVADPSDSGNATALVLKKNVGGVLTTMNNAATWTHTTEEAGYTSSTARGTITWTADFDEASERRLGAGNQLFVAGTKGSAANGLANVWVRLKFVSKDTNAI